MLYRFRSIDSINPETKEPYLFEELRNQTIYFSKLEDFNDYGETHMKIRWQGDEIAWKGLFKHYILNLESAIFMCKLSDDENDIKKLDIFMIDPNCDDFCKITGIDEKYAKQLVDISMKFIETPIVKAFIRLLTEFNPKIDEKELNIILFIVHQVAFSFFKNYPEFDCEYIDTSDEGEYYEKFKFFFDKTISQEKDHFNEIIEAMKSQLIKEKELSFKMKFLIMDFPMEYIKQIKCLTYPERYVSCFTEKFDNNAMWGYYTNSHRGVCLEFNPKIIEDREYIELYNEIGVSSISGRIYDYVNFEFKKITYSDIETFPEFNFFEQLGKLTPLQMRIFLVDNKKVSQFYNYSDEWRKKYWKIFERMSICKTKDWEHEAEKRLTLDNAFFEYGSAEKRNLKYKFECLNGIIFGLKIDEKIKSKIIEIIAEECNKKNRKDFNFYKLFYLDGKLIKEKCLYSTMIFKKLLKEKDI